MRCLMWVHSGAGGARSAARTTAPISGLFMPGASDEDTEAFLSVLNEGMLEADYGRARSPHTYHLAGIRVLGCCSDHIRGLGGLGYGSDGHSRQSRS